MILRLLKIIIVFTLFGNIVTSQIVTLTLKGTVTYINDFNNVLNDEIIIDDTITGTIVYYANIIDSNADTTVGNYYNTLSPSGMLININSITFQTDSSNINLLVETVCRPSNKGGSSVVFKSYNNLFPFGNNSSENRISWQLDDPFGIALNNDSLISKIDLNKFEQLSGLSIEANYTETFDSNYFIRGYITEIISTVKDADSKIIEIDSSILVLDTITIKVDTLQEHVVDYDGNVYSTVKIGDQIWLRENLKSIHYADGTPIEDVYVYNNDENNSSIYGRLYTWEATMNGSQSSISIPSGIQGVCPVGWHVPSDNEWYALIKYLGGTTEAGAKLKEDGINYWGSPNEGADNASFFTGRPAGCLQSGNFCSLGTTASFWSTSEYNEGYARYVFLDNLTTRAVIYNDGNKLSNFSVRCIKVDDISNNTYDINGNSYTDVYPNPASQILFLNGLTKNAIISIFDLSGKIVINNQITSNHIDIQKLKGGIYIIKIISKIGVTTSKFIKQ